MTSKLATQIIELVQAKKDQATCSTDIAVELGMVSKSDRARVSVEISHLVHIGTLRYGENSVVSNVPGGKKRSHKSVELAPIGIVTAARERVYSPEMAHVLSMILNGVSAHEIADRNKLSRRLVGEMVMNLTHEDGKTRRQAMRRIVGSAWRKRVADGLQAPPPSAPSRKPKWEKPMLYSSIFALAQGQSIDKPVR